MLNNSLEYYKQTRIVVYRVLYWGPVLGTLISLTLLYTGKRGPCSSLHGQV